MAIDNRDWYKERLRERERLHYNPKEFRRSTFRHASRWVWFAYGLIAGLAIAAALSDVFPR